MREVGALLDARTLHGKRTARQQLRWLAHAGGLPRARVGEVLDEVGLADVADRRAGGIPRTARYLEQIGIRWRSQEVP